MQCYFVAFQIIAFVVQSYLWFRTEVSADTPNFRWEVQDIHDWKYRKKRRLKSGQSPKKYPVTFLLLWKMLDYSKSHSFWLTAQGISGWKRTFSMLSMSVAFIILQTFVFHEVIYTTWLNILLHPEYSFRDVWQANKALLIFLIWKIKDKIIRKTFNLYCSFANLSTAVSKL